MFFKRAELAPTPGLMVGLAKGWKVRYYYEVRSVERGGGLHFYATCNKHFHYFITLPPDPR